MWSKDKVIAMVGLALFFCMFLYFIWSNNEKSKMNDGSLKSKFGLGSNGALNWTRGGYVS